MNTFIHTLSHCQTATHQKASTVITNKTPTKSTVYIQTISSGGNFGNQQKEKRKKSTKRLRLRILCFFSFLPQLSLSLSPTEILSAHADFAKTTGGTELEISHIGCTDHKPGFLRSSEFTLQSGPPSSLLIHIQEKKVNSGMP